MKPNRLVVNGFIVLTALLPAAFGSPFQNGGFELPVITGGPDFATVPTGWTKFDPSCGGTANCNGGGLFMQLYSTFGLPTTGGQGTQAFGFGGNGTSSGSLLQTFDTTPGSHYHITYQYVIQQGTGFEDLVLDVLSGAVSALATNSAGCTGDPGCLASSGDTKFNNLDWITHSLDFTASSASTTIRFSDFSGTLESQNDSVFTNWGLDAVTISQTSGASAPEPSTMALLALAGIMAVQWRRRIGRYSGPPAGSPWLFHRGNRGGDEHFSISREPLGADTNFASDAIRGASTTVRRSIRA